MSNTESPDVEVNETNVPDNLATQSGLPNMSSTKIFKVQSDMLVEGTVSAVSFIGDGSQLTGLLAVGDYAIKAGYNPADPLDVTSIVLDTKDGIDPATFRGDVINDAGDIIVDVSSTSATFSGTLLGATAGNVTTPTGSHTILDAGTDGTDGSLTVTDITADGTVDFTGATLIGISAGGIDLNDLSVSVDAAGTANLAYNDLTGVFTYTPPDLTSYITASSTDTLTNKSGSNSQWTNDEGFTTNTGTVTPSSTDVFTNKSGSNSQWTNDEGFTTNVGDITEVVAGTSLSGGATSGSATLNVANDGITATQLNVTGDGTSGQVLASDGDGSFSWVAQSGGGGGISLTDLSVTVASAGTANLAYNNTNGVFTYTPPDLSTYLTASSTATLTNKSGNISQWTNDSGYTTNTGDITAVVAGTGLSGGATSGSATLNIDSTVATLTGAQTLTNKALTSPALTTPTIEGGASDWQFSVSGNDLIISYGGASKAKIDTSGNLTVTGNIIAFGTI